MFRKIKLYGNLAEYVGAKEFEANVNSVAEAVRFLLCNFEDIEHYMSPNYYQVKVGNFNVGEDEIGYPVGQEDIHFVPVVSGSGGLGKALLGGALIALSMGAFGAFAGGTIFSGAATVGAKVTFGIGASLLLNGVSEMLFPLPKAMDFKTEDDPSVSFQFNSIQNVSRAGIPVPLVYGEMFVGSIVISAALDTAQVDVDDD